MRTTILSTLRTQVRERADQENSLFCSDAEVNRYISASHAELYDLLVRANPEFYQKEQTITGDGSASTFAVASDYYGTVGVDYRYTTGVYRSLDRIPPSERNMYDYSATGIAIGYRFTYNTATPTTPLLQLLPTPQNGDVYRHIYTVAPSVLSDDTDIVDGVAGWEEYIVIDAAIKCLEKEESSTSALVARKQAMLDRIQTMAENRTIESSGRIGTSSGGGISDPASWRYSR